MRKHVLARRMPFIMALLSLLCSPFSEIEPWAQVPSGRAAFGLEGTVDASIKPGNDFFAYANGAWLKAAVIPAGRDRWAVRDEINERTRQQIEALLDDARTSSPRIPRSHGRRFSRRVPRTNPPLICGRSRRSPQRSHVSIV